MEYVFTRLNEDVCRTKVILSFYWRTQFTNKNGRFTPVFVWYYDL